MIRVEKFITFFKITEFKETDKRIENIIRALTTKDYKTEEDIPLGYFRNGDVLRVPIGVGKLFLDRFLYTYEYIDRTKEFSSPKTLLSYKMKNNPYEEQKNIIDFTLEHFKSKNSMIIDLFTGTGKTFTSITICHKIQKRPIIFVKTTYLKEQWVKAFKEHTTIGDNCFYSEGPQSLFELHDCDSGFDAFIITHATIQLFIKQFGYEALNKLLIRNKIGIKIFDEFDTEMRNMLRLDCHTNIHYTLYLSATTFKSSHIDNMVFQNVFKDIEVYGKCVFSSYTPDRECFIVTYNSEPGREFYKCYNYDKTFNQVKYHKWLFNSFKYIEALRIPIEEIKKELHRKDYKVAIFVALIDACDIMKDVLVNEFKINIDEVGIYNSSISRSEKVTNLDKKVIVTTSKSFGRGVDVKTLEDIVNLEFFSSLSIFDQLCGRVGRYKGKYGRMWDLVDLSFTPVESAYKKKIPHYKKQFKSYKIIDIRKEKKNV